MDYLHPNFFRSLSRFHSVRELICQVDTSPMFHRFARLLQTMPQLSTPNLTLSCRRRTRPFAPYNATARRPQQVCLTSLSIDVSIRSRELAMDLVHAPFIRWIRDNTFISCTLRKFDYRCACYISVEVIVVDECLRRCGASLEDVSLREIDRPHRADIVPILSLEHNTNLQTLCLGLISSSLTALAYQAILETLNWTHLQSLRLIFDSHQLESNSFETKGIDETICNLNLMDKCPTLLVHAELRTPNLKQCSETPIEPATENIFPHSRKKSPNSIVVRYYH
ncbi:hypothetical protein QCA50_011796 [Cerrena zonata]|uniref:Uncharacterized protein n=1 Tax=Cerrena zonata TaxID=2478898 RepID=A0AAW0G5D8_9APHY